jgi:CRP/FNR family transcriptional regulator, cyclic AMP receptor protein
VPEVVEATADDPDPLVQQTLAWAHRGERPRGIHGRQPMLTIEKVMILKGAQMFANTPEEVLTDVASIVEEVDLKVGEVIFRKGEVGDSMYIIIEGQVRVFDGDRTINQLGRRDIFGELALLDPEPRSASIAAITDTRLLRIDRETFTELMAGNMSIVRGILHVLCDRLRRLIPVSNAPPAAPGPSAAASSRPR